MRPLLTTTGGPRHPVSLVSRQRIRATVVPHGGGARAPLVLAAGVGAQRVGRREDLVAELLEPDQVHGRVERKDHRIALPGSQALRPARLGDGEHLSGRRIGHFAVNRQGSAQPGSGKLGNEHPHLIAAGIGVVFCLIRNNS